ncbi:MAG: aldehyde dehydrogenase family protein [Thermoplasmatales archaeon]
MSTWTTLPSSGKPKSSFHYEKTSPIDGRSVLKFYGASEQAVQEVCQRAMDAHLKWKQIPVPKRQELLLELYEEIKNNKTQIADLIQLEVGKIRTEAEGEVQEALDMALFCIGLCRTLGGQIFPSERESHFMFENWQPLGVCGVITAFNFPVAVWAWNALIAITCGNSVVWKPSELTPATSIFIAELCESVCQKHGFSGLLSVALGGAETGRFLVESELVRLVSATGSVKMGEEVTKVCAPKFKKLILELGGNNAVVIHQDANLDLALRAVYFGIVGTAGQRCTSIRRLILHRSVKAEFINRLKSAFEKVTIGDPRKPETKMGPLITDAAATKFEEAVKICVEKGNLLTGGRRLEMFGSRNYVEPTLVEVSEYFDLIDEETFAPLAYVVCYSDLEEAIEINNRVPQGLSSAIFTENLSVAQKFIQESDCGLVNVNTSTSGAEIGLAFGGEKKTGGGREAGSDAWKQYMRRQSCVVNWSGKLPLSQNVQMDI